MPKYMIISDTLKKSDIAYRAAIDTLYPHVIRAVRYPLRTIIIDDTYLYFTDCNTWNARYKTYYRNMMVIWDNNMGGILYELSNRKLKVRELK